MKVIATLNNLRISPRKARLTAELIKGLDVQAALDQLDATVKRSNPGVKKLLQSAIANAENNFGLDRDNLYIFDIRVEAGATLKRWMPKAYGRAGQILKRTCAVKLILEERIEGKGRKTKEQMEEEKAKRLAAKKKADKEAAKEQQEEEKKETTAKVSGHKDVAETEKVKKVEKKGGLTSKIFRRKSM